MRKKYTINALGEELLISREKLNKVLAKENVQPVDINAEHPEYWMLDVVKALYSGAQLDWTQERAKQAKANTELTNLKVQELEGELVRRADVIHDALQTAGVIKSLLQALPLRISAELAAESDQNRIEVLLEEEISKVLEELQGSEYIEDEAETVD